MEMLDRLDAKLRSPPADEIRQEAFRKLLTPVHFSYGSPSRIGMQFLRDHAHLL
jgi:hypothetical protein